MRSICSAFGYFSNAAAACVLKVGLDVLLVALCFKTPSILDTSAFGDVAGKSISLFAGRFSDISLWREASLWREVSRVVG